MLTPADIVNRALDAIGSEATLGDPDLQDGTKEAAAALRVYVPTLEQMLRCAHWDFARREASLTLLNDATGRTVGVDTGTPGMGTWTYEYAWPIDAVKARFVPGQPAPANTAQGVPIMTGLATAPYGGGRNRPARFIVAQDIVPVRVGAIATWSDLPDLQNVQGQALDRQQVILTNVAGASLVYTGMVPYPGQWDSLFQQAMVAALAERLAMPCLPDKKFALQVRQAQIGLAKASLTAARSASANEGWSQNDIAVDWMRVRSAGARWNGLGSDGGGSGMLWCGHDSYGFSDGSVY
jgi:hypothetical protein